jgi:hypothetical protein
MTRDDSFEQLVSNVIWWILVMAARRACVVYGTFPPDGTTPEQRESRWQASYDFLRAHGPEYASDP